MNPLDVFLSSLLKWVLIASAISVTVTGITCAVIKAVKKKRENSKITTNDNLTKKKGREKKSEKKYEQTGRLISTPHREEPTAGQLDVKIGGEAGDAINNDKYIKGSSGVLSSVQDPKLVKLIHEYVDTANLKRETDFSRVKISHIGESTKKSEVLIAPKRFVESLFIPKVCYECAVQEDQKFPVLLTYQTTENSKNFDKAETKQIVIEDKQMATELAIEFLTGMPANLAQRAEMDLSRLVDDRNTMRDSSK